MEKEFNKFESLTNSVRYFERVMRAVMNVQNRQGDRIKLSIRAGMTFLLLIAISIFLMLYTMATQINRVSIAVGEMNHSFDVVSERMEQMDRLMLSLEYNVSQLPAIAEVMPQMDEEMAKLTNTVNLMSNEMNAVTLDVAAVRKQSETMNEISKRMATGIYRINGEVNHMAQPAKSLNNMFPFMP
jgi:methyl-accepting chemotaxis protein